HRPGLEADPGHLRCAFRADCCQPARIVGHRDWLSEPQTRVVCARGNTRARRGQDPAVAVESEGYWRIALPGLACTVVGSAGRTKSRRPAPKTLERRRTSSRRDVA